MAKIMDRSEVVSISGSLKNNKILDINCVYSKVLIDYLSLKLVNINKNKLSILLGEYEKKSFIDVFRQGIAEMLLYFYLARNDIPFSTEVPLNSENDTNVDVVIKNYKGFAINLEVKCPVIPKVDYSSGLSGQLAYRFTNDKNETMDFINSLNNDIDKAAKKKGKKGSVILLPRDNKIKDTLLSCQEKFIPSDGTFINCLVISTNNHEMVSYWEYLANEANCGFFDDNSFIPHNEFNKVNAVVLTNGIELNEKYDSFSWNMENACIIIIANRFSIGFKDLLRNGIYHKLSELFPNQSLLFVEKMIENDKKKDKRLPISIYKYEIVYSWSIKKDDK